MIKKLTLILVYKKKISKKYIQQNNKILKYNMIKNSKNKS